MKYNVPTLITLLSGIFTTLFLVYKRSDLLLPSIFVLLGFGLSAYTVNCTITGHCNFWAWLLAVCYVIYGVNIIMLANNGQLEVKGERR